MEIKLAQEQKDVLKNKNLKIKESFSHESISIKPYTSKTQKRYKVSWAPVTHICNPGYLRG
jgi:hypothetical protein